MNASARKVPCQYELAVVTSEREYRRFFDDPRAARDAFMEAMARRPSTASVSSFDRDGAVIERLWHYDDTKEGWDGFDEALASYDTEAGE